MCRAYVGSRDGVSCDLDAARDTSLNAPVVYGRDVRRLGLLVIAIGCAPDKKVPVAPAIVRACPVHNLITEMWLHELFPGCATMPFVDGGDDSLPGVCGADCPRPCAIAFDDVVEHITYDDAGRWLGRRAATPEGLVETCSYANGRAASCASGPGGKPPDMTETATRDGAGRLTTIAWTDGQPRQIAYDAAGRVTAITTPTWASTTFDYDAQGRLVAEHEADPRGPPTTITYHYAADRLVERRVERPAPELTKYSYDASGRLVSVDDTHAHLDVQWRYDAAGRLASQTWHATEGPVNDHTRAFAYDCAAQPPR